MVRGTLFRMFFKTFPGFKLTSILTNLASILALSWPRGAVSRAFFHIFLAVIHPPSGLLLALSERILALSWPPGRVILTPL